MAARRDGWKAHTLRTSTLIVLLFSTACSSSLGWIFGVDQIRPEELRKQLNGGTPPQILDVSDRQNFVQGHIPGAQWADVDRLDETIEHLGLYRDRPLVTVCRGGWRSQWAAAIASGHGFRAVTNLDEGMIGWEELRYPIEKGATAAADTNARPNTITEISLVHQLASAISGLVFKPIYMLLTLILILFLHRTQSKSRDIVLIRRGLETFFAGELFCALNYLCTGGVSDSLDMLHGLGMVFMGMLISWGLFVLIDERIWGVTAPNVGCSLRRFCGTCWKQQDVSCFMQRLLWFFVPSFAIVSLMPWSAPLRSLYQVSDVLGTPVVFSYSLHLQLADFRLFPLLAFLLFIATLLGLKGGAQSLRRVQLTLFGGIGLMGFSLFRFFLLEAYRVSPVWSDFWEETTELIFILGSALLLFFYRRRLGLSFDSSEESTGESG